MKIKNQKPIFFCGLGEQPFAYKSLSKFLDIFPIDWNNIKLPKKHFDTVVGFSIGATLACDYALKKHVKNLILCSMTPGVETLRDVKADKIIFLVGEEEKWVKKDMERITKDLKCDWKLVVVPRAGHKINNNYKKVLLNTLKF